MVYQRPISEERKREDAQRREQMKIPRLPRTSGLGTLDVTQSDLDSARQFLQGDEEGPPKRDRSSSPPIPLSLLDLPAIKLGLSDGDAAFYRSYVMSDLSTPSSDLSFARTAKRYGITEDAVVIRLKKIDARVRQILKSVGWKPEEKLPELKTISQKEILNWLETPAGQQVLTPFEKRIYQDAAHRNATRTELAKRVGCRDDSSALDIYLRELQGRILDAKQGGRDRCLMMVTIEQDEDYAEERRTILNSGGGSIGGAIYGRRDDKGGYRPLQDFKTGPVRFTASSSASEGPDRNAPIEDDYSEESSA